MPKLNEPSAEVNQPGVAFLHLWRARHPGQPDPSWAQHVAGLGGRPVEGAAPAPRGRAKTRRIVEAAARKRRARARELRNLRSDDRRRRKFEAWAAQWGGQPLRLIPRALWIMCAAILADPSGSCARAALAQCGNKVFAGLVRIAARVRLDDGGYLYAWGDYRTRATVAVAMCLYGCARRARGRRRRWKFLVDGITRSALCALLTDVHTGARPGLTYLSGTYGFGGRWNAQPLGRGAGAGVGCGILTALRQVGAIYACQWAGQRFATPSGYQPNQYWICTDRPEDGAAEPDEGAALWDADQGERCAERDDEHEPPGPYVPAAPAPCARPPP